MIKPLAEIRVGPVQIQSQNLTERRKHVLPVNLATNLIREVTSLVQRHQNPQEVQLSPSTGEKSGTMLAEVAWTAAAASGDITLQRTYHGVDYVYSLGMRQGFLHNRLILTATAVMPFQNRYYGPTRDTYAENYYQHNESWYSPRQFRLGLTWRFGKTRINFKHAKKTEVSDRL